MGEPAPVRWRDRLSSRLGLAFMATALAAVAIVTAVALTAGHTGVDELAAAQRSVLADDVVAALEVAYLEADGWVDADLLPAHTLAASAGAVLIVTTPGLGELPTPPEMDATRRRLQAPSEPAPIDPVVPPQRDHDVTPDDTTDEDGSPEPPPPSDGQGGDGSPSGEGRSTGPGDDADQRDRRGSGSTGETGSTGGTGSTSETGEPREGADTADGRARGETRTLGTADLIEVSWTAAEDPAPVEADLLERLDRAIVIDGVDRGTATLLFVARADSDPAAAFRASLLTRLLLGAAVAVLLALGITAFVTLRLTRPLRQLTADVDHLRDPTRPPVTVHPPAPGELGVLRAAIDQMADDLRRHEQLRRALIADVGHELRTPVTILLAELEAIRDGVLTADDDQVGSLHEEVQRVARLVEDVASLADAEASGFTLEREPLDLAAVTRAAAQGLEGPLRAGGVAVVTRLEPVVVEGDRRRLEQVVRNLVTNAGRFSPPDTTVEVAVYADGGDAVIEVTDRGPGFAAEELPYVFDRFWRGRGSDATGGSGIGLAVVAEVVAAHGGRVAAANRSEGHGASLTVRLPRAAESLLLAR